MIGSSRRDGSHARLLPVVLRFLVSGALLYVVARLLDVGLIVTRLRELSPAWVGLALSIAVLQALVSAWRWRFTAGRLGVRLSRKDAVAEYYLGLLLNQLLPGGVTGDATRAWRHARASDRTGPAVRAVVLERASGQVVMTAVALASLLFISAVPGSWRLGAVVGVTAVLGLLLLGARSRTSTHSVLGRIWTDARRAVLSRSTWLPQLATALLLVASYITVFVVAARAIGVETPLVRLLPLVAPVLMTMLIPVTVAGWGVREGAAGALWGLVGLTPEDGVSISAAYGIIILASSLPGALMLPRAVSVRRALRAGRGRTEHPAPAERSDTEDGSPDRASGSGPG